jgi:HEAT repeat protein
VEKVVLPYLQADKHTKPEALAQQRAAIELAGDLRLAASVPSLIQILQPDQPLLDAAVEALGQIGSSEAVAPLVLVADKLVKISDRTALPLSKQPVNENDPSASKSYWLILKALGSSGTTESIRYLLSAASDYAPDKREMALSSLIRLYESESTAKALSEFTPQIRAAISTALDDPSASVRAVALLGVIALTDGDSIEAVIRLTDSPEISVSRQAYVTLEHLSVQGFGASINTAGQERLKANSNTHWARQFSQFLAGKVS